MGDKASRPGAGGASGASDAQRVVEDAIAANPVVVFSKSYCPYCNTAKRALAAAASTLDNYAGAKVFELDNMGSKGAAIQDYLAHKTGRRTVPNVFVGAKAIGGGDETAALHARGTLVSMVRNAVAAASTS